MHVLLTFGFLLAFLGTPAADAPVCTLDPLELPLYGGTPVTEMAANASPTPSELTEAEAEAVLQEYAACINSSDPALAWAIFTPGWFAAEFHDSTEHYQPAFEQQLDSGNFPVIEPLVLEEVSEVTRLEDGRVAVTATFSSGGRTWTDTLILAQIDGVWLIDEVEAVDPAD